MIPWGEFKVEVIFLSQEAPRGVPGVPGSPGGGEGGDRRQGGSGELFGLPIWRKSIRIRPRGYFFMLRSILILPDLEIPLKSQKIRKKRISKKKRVFLNLSKL